MHEIVDGYTCFILVLAFIVLCQKWRNKDVQSIAYGPLTRNIKLRVAHAPEMPGTFSPPPRVSDPDMHHGTCVTHVPWYMPGSLTDGFLWSRWRGKRSRHSRRMRNLQFYVSGKKPLVALLYYNWDQGPISQMIFLRHKNSVCISFCLYPICNKMIAMKFCWWHYSCVVVTCVNFCSDMFPCNGVTPKPIFHQIWNTMEKSFMKSW